MVKLIWIDNDISILRAEQFDLELLEVESLFFERPSMALDWFEDSRSELGDLRAIVVDAMLPRNSDRRFACEDDTPVGVLFCKRLMDLEQWEDLKPKIVLYTRLPNGPRLQEVRAQAEVLELELNHKSMTSRIALWLREEGKI